MAYTDFIVLAVHKDKFADYKKMTRKAGKVWIKHGALSYTDHISDDVKPGKVTSFPQAVKLQDGELVAVTVATFKSRKERDAIAKKVFADPVLKNFNPQTLPFDPSRIFWGGFKPILSL